MRISTRLRLGALLPLFMAFVVATGLFFSYRASAGLQGEQLRIAEVRTSLSQLNELARSYVLNHDDRSRRQFLQKQSETARLLAEQTGAESDVGRYRSMRRDVDSMRALFLQLVANNARRRTTTETALFDEADARISSALFIRSDRATFVSGQVAIDNIAASGRSQRRWSGIIIALVLAATIVLMVALLLIANTITRSLKRLTTGTTALGAGDLGYRIGLQSRDELGDLGWSFDQMSERLQGLTVSRDDLEREVEERRRAEDELRRSLEEQARLSEQLDTERAQLRTVLDNMAEAVGVWTPDGRQIEMNEATVRMHGFRDRQQMLKRLSEFDDVTIRTPDGEEVPMDRWPAARVLRGETFANWELEVNVGSTHTRFIGSYSGAPVLNAEGDLALGVVTVHDVTVEQDARLRLQRELARTTALKESSEAAASLDPHALADRVLEMLQRLLEVKSGVLYLLDEETGVLRNLGLRGYPEEMAPLFASVPVDEESVSGRSVLKDEVLTFSFEELPPATRRRAEAAGEEGGHWVVVPVHAGGKAIGDLTLVFGEDRELGEDDVGLLRSIADQVGVALENASLHASTEDELERTRLLEDVALAGSISPDLSAVSRAVLAAVARHMDLEGGDIRVLEDDVLRLVTSFNYPEENVALISEVDVETSDLMGARAVREKRTLTHEDEVLTPERRRVLAAQGLSASRYVYVPVEYRDRAVGELSLVFAGRRSFTGNELSLFSSIAQILGQAIENARLFEARRKAEEQATRELEMTTQWLKAADALASLDLEDILGVLGDSVTQITGAGRVVVELFESDGSGLFVGYSRGQQAPPAGYAVPAASVSDEERAAMQKGVTQFVEAEAGALPEAVTEFRRQFAYTYYARVPLRAGRKLLGAMLIDEPGRRHELSERDVAFLEGLAPQAAVAIENARLFRAERESARLGEALGRIDQAAHSSLQVEDVVRDALAEGAVAIGAESAVIDGLEREGGSVVWYDWGFEESIVGHHYTDEQNPLGALSTRTGRSIVVEDALTDPRVDNETMKSFGFRSLIVAPLIVRGEPIAALYFNYHSERHRFTSAEIDFVSKVASSLSLAIENSRLFEQRSRQAQYAEALNRINAAVHSTLEFDEIMSRVVIDTAEALNVDASAVHMHREGHWEFTYSHNLPEGLRQTRLTDAQSPLSMRVLNTREPIVANDVLHDERANVRLMERYGITALIAVPLTVRTEVLGVLFAGCLGSRMTFVDEQVDFTQKVAATLALALENARLYETERDIADRLQEALLALPVSIPGIEFAHAYHSATESARVGGDFYDIFELDRDLIGVTMGDVAGKGLDAAVLTSLVKNTIRAHANERGKTPAEILTLTNEVVFKSTPVEAFVTVFFGVLDCRDGMLVYCNAGHTTAAVARADGTVGRLSSTGPILGAFEQVAFDQGKVCCLDQDETLFLYTDGLTEARRDGELYGEERLFTLLGTLHDGGPEYLIPHVLDDVLEYSGNQLRDDLALLAVKRTAPPKNVPSQQKLELR